MKTMICMYISQTAQRALYRTKLNCLAMGLYLASEMFLLCLLYGKSVCNWLLNACFNDVRSCHWIIFDRDENSKRWCRVCCVLGIDSRTYDALDDYDLISPEGSKQICFVDLDTTQIKMWEQFVNYLKYRLCDKLLVANLLFISGLKSKGPSKRKSFYQKWVLV